MIYILYASIDVYYIVYVVLLYHDVPHILSFMSIHYNYPVQNLKALTI
jgi:hypothetical protein